jgi:hypothetical protein
MITPHAQLKQTKHIHQLKIKITVSNHKFRQPYDDNEQQQGKQK